MIGDTSITVTATLGAASASTIATVLDLNDQPPIANDDRYFVNQDTTLQVFAWQGVLAGGGSDHSGGDTDPDHDPLIAALVAGPAHGSVVLAADGSFSYMPDTGFTGEDSFTYKANDGRSDSNVATVTLGVAVPLVSVSGGDVTLQLLDNAEKDAGSSFVFRVVLAAPAGVGGVQVSLNANPKIWRRCFRASQSRRAKRQRSSLSPARARPETRTSR